MILPLLITFLHVVFLMVDGNSVAKNCNGWKLEHSGCALPSGATPSCANVTLLYHSEERSQPPFGQRFAYDTGGRTISTIKNTSIRYCAMQCLIESNCRGFTFIAQESTVIAASGSPPSLGTCKTVNDTQHVGTRLETWSYTLTRTPNCTARCESGDGKAFASSGPGQPVARGGGLQQCQQACDIAEAKLAGSCVAIVYNELNAWCSLVNSSASIVSVLTPQQSYRRVRATLQRATTQPMAQWVVDASVHVFEAARPWQTAFCSNDSVDTSIDWATSPGSFLSSQVAMLATDVPLAVRFDVSDLQRSDGNKKIPGSLIELSQVGFVKAKSCPVAICGSRAYSPELTSTEGYYPDILQPLGGGFPSSLVLRPNRTRAVHVALLLPSGTPPGDYHGVLTPVVNASGLSAAPITIRLAVWPIAASCVRRELKDYGAAYGFDHKVRFSQFRIHTGQDSHFTNPSHIFLSVHQAVKLLYPDRPDMPALVQAFTAARHVPAYSLDLWTPNTTAQTVAALLRAQDRFLAEAMYLVRDSTLAKR